MAGKMQLMQSRPAAERQAACNGRVFRILAPALALLLAGGCMSGGGFREDISTSRAHSYRRWLSECRSETGSHIILTGELSLEECIGIAMSNNKQLAAIRLEREKAAGKIDESYSIAFPKVDVNAGYTRFDQAPLPDGHTGNYSAGARLSQPLYRGGAVRAGIRAAQMYADFSDESVREVVQAVVFDVSKAWLDVLLAHELLQVSEQAVELSGRHVKDVTDRREQGMASDYDVLRARVEVSNYEAEMIQNRNRLSLLKTSFFKLLGVSQESTLDFDGGLEYEQVTAELEDVVEEAFAHRPELIRAELEWRLLRENLAATRAGKLPEIDLFFEEMFSNPHPHDATSERWGDSWMAGLTLRWPLFDGFRTRGLLRQARAELERGRIRLADQEEKVLLEAKQALLNIHDAESFVESQRANVGRAEEGLKLVELGYREGVNTELEVRDARQALLRARALWYQAAHSHRLAVLGLRKATGALAPRYQQQQQDDTN